MKDKMTFRPTALAKLRKRQPYRFADSKKVERKLEELMAHYKPRSILFYLPMDHEVNLLPALKKVRKKSAVYVPFMVGDSFKMIAYRLPLFRGQLGIYQTKNSHKKLSQVDMIVVPILGVDSSYRRIGFGKGMYDRFYARLRQKPLTVFVQNSLCYTPRVITNHYDIKANYLITPKHFFKIKA